MHEYPPARSDVYAVVLAAGESRRFGGAKLLEHIDGETLVGRAASLAEASCGSRSVLLTGYRADEIAAAAGDRCRIVLQNPRYREGLGTSIALAAQSLDARAAALLLLLADQPLVDVVHLRRILAAWSGRPDEIVATGFADTTGPPVLMPRATFPALRALTGDRGARDLFRDPAYSLKVLPFEAAAIDIDTAEDLARLR
jgi:molybdenum cofactor cytidylyltransferase